jgi:hypothetical protein
MNCVGLARIMTTDRLVALSIDYRISNRPRISNGIENCLDMTLVPGLLRIIMRVGREFGVDWVVEAGRPKTIYFHHHQLGQFGGDELTYTTIRQSYIKGSRDSLTYHRSAHPLLP